VACKSKEGIIGRKTRDSDHGDVDGSSRLDGECVVGGYGECGDQQTAEKESIVRDPSKGRTGKGGRS
jgi:hypothetical protein